MKRLAILAAGAISVLFAGSASAADHRCGSPHYYYTHKHTSCWDYHPNGHFPKPAYWAIGPQYNGYYDSGYYGPGYYEPQANGFVFIDVSGHKRYHSGKFDGRGFHGRSNWHR